jgi:hypothetical protein
MRTPEVAVGQVGRWLVLGWILVVILVLVLASGRTVFVPVRPFAESAWPAGSLVTLLVLVLVLILTLILGKLRAVIIPVTAEVTVPAWPAPAIAITILVLVLILAVVLRVQVKVACPKRKRICPRHNRRPTIKGSVPMSSAVKAE